MNRLGTAGANDYWELRGLGGGSASEGCVVSHYPKEIGGDDVLEVLSRARDVLLIASARRAYEESYRMYAARR